MPKFGDLLGQVRLLAATLDADQQQEEEQLALHRLCDEDGIDQADRVIRRVAHQVAADHEVVVPRASLVPEICVTASGVYWHPVAAIRRRRSARLRSR